MFPRRHRTAARHGVTTVEFAFVISALVMVIFAGLEFARVNIIRNTIENAAYEGARVGMVPGATNLECTAAAQAYLDLIGIQNSTVTTLPNTIDDNTTDVTVTVSVPMDIQNGYVFPTYFIGDTLGASITLPREVH